MNKTFDLLIRIKKEHVRDICTFFEYFEGMAAIRTPSPEPGEFANLQIMVSEDYRKEFEYLMERLQARSPWTLVK
ncbi:MAG: hypothetical protein KKB81_00275 [Candidatus Margulisbacteria bacterium]|nr:hypothetical protein [Candidatus Margulisiibacteriota bacterium]MBU1022391.1 hypothetical protein [Candidatus Margulisiibacteriota bacterium]MBU1729057.1 hypothetical protein [Candidatus Margulisiibacteriota bacterium]MBU1954522.1 hypothetical protein [Candidatus Margulisiibacteriota bacterium]